MQVFDCYAALSAFVTRDKRTSVKDSLLGRSSVLHVAHLSHELASVVLGKGLQFAPGLKSGKSLLFCQQTFRIHSQLILKVHRAPLEYR